MTDQWKTADGTPIPADWTPGLPLSDDWIAGCGCSGPSTKTSIVDDITLTGSPAAITSVDNDKALWALVLNDATPQKDFRLDRFDDTGALADSPMTIVRATGVVTFHDPVMLSRDPIQPMEAATREFVLANAAGLTDAPNDGTLYGRKSAAWAHLTHTDITDWTATLAPYALTANVPVASTTMPLMDGTAAVGTASTWARADHVHPVDTSRYAASNPSGYQTAAQVSASIAAAAYVLPTASTTVLGGVKVDGSTITIAGGVISGSPSGVPEAPTDGTQYGRQSGAWTAISVPTGPPVTISDTPPSSPSVGALWWDSVGGQLYVRYQDPNTTQWVPVVNQGPTGVSGQSSLPYFNDPTVYLTTPLVPNATISSSSQAANVIYLTPVYVPFARTFTKISAVVAATAGVNFRLGVYAADQHTGAAGACLFDSGSLSATAGGVITVSMSLALNPQAYYLAWWTGAALAMTAAGSAGITSLMGMPLGGSTWGSPIAGLRFNQTFSGGFPNLTSVTPSAFIQSQTTAIIGIA